MTVSDHILTIEPRIASAFWAQTQSHCDTCLFGVHSSLQNLPNATQI